MFRKNNKGFTLLEIMFAIGFLGIASLIYVKYKHSEQKMQTSKTLGEQAQLSSKYFANYILQNESQIAKIASTTTPIIIPFDQVINSGITPTGINNTNILNQKACVSILKNPNSSNLEAVMYYVSNGTTNKLEEQDVVRAVHSLSGVAGLYKNGQVITNSWTISSGSPYFAGANNCVSGYTLIDKSLVVNLTMLPEFNRNTLPDVAVKRVQDLTESLGNAGNKNTTLSNITFTSGKGIYMNNTGQPELIATGSTLAIQNGDLMARAIQGSESIISGTLCQSAEVGKVAQQNDPRIAGQVQSSVICSYNPLVCGGSGYCYTPTVRTKVVYNDSTNSGKLGSTFYCPANLPFLSTATAYQSGNANPSVTILTGTINGYTVPKGAQATGLTPNPGTPERCRWGGMYCSNKCPDGKNHCASYDSHCGKNEEGKIIQSITICGETFNMYCRCSPGTPAIGNAYIQSATCTNKGTINVN